MDNGALKLVAAKEVEPAHDGLLAERRAHVQRLASDVVDHVGEFCRVVVAVERSLYQLAVAVFRLGQEHAPRGPVRRFQPSPLL